MVVVVAAGILLFFMKPLSILADEKESLLIEQGEKVSLFEPIKLAPSRIMEEQTITITNPNKRTVEIETTLQFQLEKEGLDQQTLSEMLNFYEIQMKIDYQGTTHTLDWTSLNQVNDHLQALQLEKLPPNESLQFTYSIRLDEAATNEFQSIVLAGELIVKSLTDKKDKVETIINDKDGKHLPNTATNTWNYFYIGTLLLIGGAALVIFYSIRMFQRKRGVNYVE